MDKKRKMSFIGQVKRGQIYMADLDPAKGSEKQKSRRVVIVSNDIGHQRNSPIVIAIPLTDALDKRRFPFFVFINPNFKNKLDKTSVVDCNQIRVLDVKERLTEHIGDLSNHDMYEINKALSTVLHLKECPKCYYTLMPNGNECQRCGYLTVTMCACNHIHNNADKYCPQCGRSREVSHVH